MCKFVLAIAVAHLKGLIKVKEKGQCLISSKPKTGRREAEGREGSI